MAGRRTQKDGRSPEAEARTPRPRRALLFGMLAALGLFELGLHFILGNFGQSRLLDQSKDPDICLENRAHADVLYTGWLLKIPGTHMRTNRLGGRGAEVGPKTPSTLRILALGDSFTFGQGVEQDFAFPSVMRESLRAGGLDAEVLNFGVPGHGTPQSVALLEKRLLPLRPDLVLLDVFANDLSAEDSYCTRGGGGFPLAPFFLQRVYTTRLLFMLTSPLHQAAPPSAATIAALGTPEQRFQTAVRRAAALGVEHGFRVGVVLLTDRDMYGHDSPHCRGCTAPHDLLAGLPVRVLDMSATWKRLQTDVAAHFIPGEEHLSVVGNAIMGEAIAGELRRWTELSLPLGSPEGSPQGSPEASPGGSPEAPPLAPPGPVDGE